MIDFGFSEIAASDLLLANDVAELVASSSAVVGAERATAHAIASVDPATLAAARDRLQLWALSGASRTALKERPGLLDDLRARLAPAREHRRAGHRRPLGALILGVSAVARRTRPGDPGLGAAAVPGRQRSARWLFVPLWPVMQLGNLAVGTVAGLVVALARRRAAGGDRRGRSPPG